MAKGKDIEQIPDVNLKELDDLFVKKLWHPHKIAAYKLSSGRYEELCKYYKRRFGVDQYNATLEDISIMNCYAGAQNEERLLRSLCD